MENSSWLPVPMPSNHLKNREQKRSGPHLASVSDSRPLPPHPLPHPHAENQSTSCRATEPDAQNQLLESQRPHKYFAVHFFAERRLKGRHRFSLIHLP